MLPLVTSLHPVRTAEDGIYRYTDATGSGWFVLVDFAPGDRQTIALLAAP